MIDVETIGVGVDTKDVAKANRDLDSFGKTADKASRSADGTTKSMASMASGVKALIASYVGLNAVASISKISDDYSKYNAQLKLATSSQKEFTKALDDVRAIATTAQVSISSISTLYGRLNLALKDVGVSQGDVAKISETVALSLKVAGASAAESSSAMLQLSQAFGSGVLRGEEFNAMMESAPNLMRALAESIGVPVGQLRSLASEGQITSDTLTKAFTDEKLLNALRGQAKEVQTMGGAWQVVKNSIEGAIGRLIEYTKLNQKLNEKADLLAQVFAPETENDRKVAARKELERLQGRGGNMYGKNYRQKLINEQLRILDPSLGNKIASGQTLQENIAPNFKVTRTEESYRKQKEFEDKQAMDLQAKIEVADRLRKQQNDEILKEIQYQMDFDMDMLEAKNKYEIEEFRKLEKQKEDALKEAHKKELERLKELQDRANENFKEAQKETEKQAREYESIFTRANENLSRSLTDSIIRGFERGESFITNFKTAITNAFRGYFVNVGVNFVQGAISGVAGKIGGSFMDMIGLGNGQSGGFAGVMKDIANIFTTSNQSIISGIESIGASISNGMGGIRDTIGGYLGANAKFVSNALSYGGAVLQLAQGNWAGAAGTALGTFMGGPIGGAIGSFLGGAVGKLFGGKKRTPRYSSGISTSYSGGEFTATNLSRLAGFNKDAGGREGMTNAAEIFSKSLGTLLGAFNIDSVINTNLQFFRRKGAWGYGSASVDGVQAAGTGRIYNKNQQAAYDEFINAFLTVGLVNAIKVSKIPEGLKALFDGFADREKLGNMIQAVVNLGNAQDSLISLYNLTADQAGRVSTATGLAGDELVAFVNKLASVGTASMTVGDVLIKVRNSLMSSFGGSMYNSLKEFDNALKNIDKTTQSGIEAFAGLFQLREQFAQFQSQIDGLKSGVRGALLGVVSESERTAMMREDLARMFADLNREVPASIQELIALGKSIDYTTAEGLNLALVFPALVDAFNQTEQGVKSLMGTLNASYFTTRADLLSASASDNPRAFVKGQAETNASLLAEIKQMKTDNADMKAIMAAVVEYTRQQQRIIDDWDVNGMPAERVA